MADKSNIENTHQGYLDLWNTISSQVLDYDVDTRYLKTSAIIGQYAAINNQMVTIYNMQTQMVLYVSENYHYVSGYECTKEEYQKWSSFYFFRDLPIAQSWFIFKISIWFKTKIKTKIKNNPKYKSLLVYLHNFSASPPKSKDKYKMGILAEALELDEDGSPLIFLIAKKSIQSSIKDNSAWWAEVLINGNERYSYHQNNKNFSNSSIISERELEILQLIEKGKNTKEIAEILQISFHTVEKHRKNMIEKTGAKDVSMLINICKWCKIL
jgi:DNA-binding CsgD family transcriptional regulator